MLVCVTEKCGKRVGQPEMGDKHNLMIMAIPIQLYEKVLRAKEKN